MFKILIFIFVASRVNTAIGSDFEEHFTRIIQENSDPEQQLYGATQEGSGSNGAYSVSFPQKLNHFKWGAKNQTWEQRTIILNTYYEREGPFFIYIFGNERASADWLRKSRVMSYAKDHKALVFGLEHRFYGDSRPAGNTSLANLNYLNIQQALADIAYFIEKVNGISIVPANTKWVTFGGFYGGSLSAWARMKYPHLVHGAVASSPLLSIKSEFPEYLESVKNAYFHFGDTSCGRNLEEAFLQVHKTIQTSEGRIEASKIFKLCSTLLNFEEDKAVLLGTLANVVATAVEQNHNNHFSIDTVCKIMNNNQTSAMQNLGTVNRRYLSENYFGCWYSQRDQIVSFLREIRYESRIQTDRLWLYQQCTQLGFNLPSTKSTDMFGEYKPELESTARLCQDVFGPEFDQQTIDEGVKEINIEFGGKAFNAGQVALVYGSLDPWRSAGITEKSKNAQHEVICIEGGSRCTDLERASKNDDLEKSIRKINDLLKSWLA